MEIIFLHKASKLRRFKPQLYRIFKKLFYTSRRNIGRRFCLFFQFQSSPPLEYRASTWGFSCNSGARRRIGLITLCTFINGVVGSGAAAFECCGTDDEGCLLVSRTSGIKSRPIKQAKTVMTIFGLTSTISSGNA